MIKLISYSAVSYGIKEFVVDAAIKAVEAEVATGLASVNTELGKKANSDNPTFTGDAYFNGDNTYVANGFSITSTSANKDKSHFSMNRLGGSTQGTYSSTLGYACSASGEASHAEGNWTQAAGKYSHAEGDHTQANAECSHAEGISTQANGMYSHSEGQTSVAGNTAAHAEGFSTKATAQYAHSEGQNTTASGVASHSEGGSTQATATHAHAEGQTTVAQGEASHAEGVGAIAYERAAHAEGINTRAFYSQHASGKYNVYRVGPTGDADTTGTLFMVGCGTGDGARSNAFRVDANGKSYFAQAITTSGADFAEFLEWADGNPDNEDRRGKMVALMGDKIRYATNMTECIGVISAEGAFVGNSADEEWQNKYLTDVFGTRLTQTVEIPATINEETGEVITPAYTATQFVINPEYNNEEVYIPRAERREWTKVGLVGQLVVVDDGSCVVGGRVKPGVDGVGTASNDGTGYIVMARIDENHIKVLVK